MNQIVKDLRRITYFDPSGYLFEFVDGSKRAYPSVTTWLGVLQSYGLRAYREEVGTQEADRRMQEAGLAGSRIHHACYLHMTGGVVMYEPWDWVNPNPDLKERNAAIVAQCRAKGVAYIILHDQEEMIKYNRFKAFERIVKPRVLAVEQRVYSVEDGGAGTLDFVLEIKGGSYDAIGGMKPVVLPDGVGVWDIKSGRWDPKHLLQVGTYRKFLNENRPGFMYRKPDDGAEQVRLEFEPANHAGIIHLNADTRAGTPGLKIVPRSAEESSDDYRKSMLVKAAWHVQNPTWELDISEFETIGARADVEDDLVKAGVLTHPEDEKLTQALELSVENVSRMKKRVKREVAP